MAVQRAVIVTGGASGIGLGAARLLGEEGWATVLVDRDPDALDVAVTALREAGATVAAALPADIRETETAERAVAAAEAQGHELRGLVNAAAAVFQGSLWDLDPDDLDRCHAVNVRGTFQMMRAAAPAMRAHGGGSIVNVGSGDSFLGERDQLAYCTTKAGVLNMTRAAAMDAADAGIRVNCVCPGVIDTPFFRAGIAGARDPDGIVAMVEGRQPLGLLAPDAVAQAIAFLVSDRGAGMTGSALVVDGGLSASWWYERRA
ncbi:NAD-dependent glycerol dehydrogenase [Baekduia alba]|uniref:SDR family NAD(P)-dependent oxidoreductase n=1 Tax=Baekduia alba TaxID=2997333 RepID=UPI00233FFCA0|nr:SDR family oxidoreductase [Baekduia alba]WCB96860.1 NAD-dependent glycerol dehydrogenase [Baekduia alba]